MLNWRTRAKSKKYLKTTRNLTWNQEIASTFASFKVICFWFTFTTFKKKEGRKKERGNKVREIVMKSNLEGKSKLIFNVVCELIFFFFFLLEKGRVFWFWKQSIQIAFVRTGENKTDWITFDLLYVRIEMPFLPSNSIQWSWCFHTLYLSIDYYKNTLQTIDEPPFGFLSQFKKMQLKLQNIFDLNFNNYN